MKTVIKILKYLIFAVAIIILSAELFFPNVLDSLAINTLMDSIFTMFLLVATGILFVLVVIGDKISIDSEKKLSYEMERLIKADEKMESNVPSGTTVIQLNQPSPSGVISVGQLEGPSQDELSTIVYFMSQIFPSYSAVGFIYDGAQNGFVINSIKSKNLSIVPNKVIPAGQGLIGDLAVTGKSLISGDILNLNKQLEYYNENVSVKSILAVPIFSPSKVLLGALAVDSMDKNVFRENHKATMERFSYLAAALISNIRMRKAQAKTADQFKMLHSATVAFQQAKTPVEVMNKFIEIAQPLYRFSRIMTIEFHNSTNKFKILSIFGQGTEIPTGLVFPFNDGLYSQALSNNQLVCINKYSDYRGKYFRFAPNEPDNPNIASLIIFPMVGTEGYSGLISLESTIENAFTPQLQQTLSTLAMNATTAFQKTALFQKTEKMAKTDGLTGLTNHRTFQELLHTEIMRTARNNAPLSLLLFDIDHFKNFNDTYGHAVGDLVLKLISKTLRDTVRAQDTPVRYGGEEFCVLAPETAIEQAVQLAERVRVAIETLEIKTDDGQILHVTVSIGCAALPLHASTQQDLVNASDTAMYHSKEAGRNQVSIWDRHMKMENK